MKHLPVILGLALAGVAVTAIATADDKSAHHHQDHSHEVMSPGEPVPGESLYQLKMELTSQHAKRVPLATLRGKPTLITMFYASCDSVCPLIAFTLRRMESTLTPAQRARLRVVMVSFDPERDTPEALKEFARANKIDNSRWLLARAPENQVRELAAVLGIRYRKLDGGAFSHSTVIALLDENGLIQSHTSTLSELDPTFMKALDRALSSEK